MPPTERAKRPIAIVTGASRGIGKSVALRLAEQGAHVFACARSSSTGEARSHGDGWIEHRHLDVTDHGQCRALCSDITGEHGSIDILVNNAAVYLEGPGPSSGRKFLTLPWDAISGTVLTNLLAQMDLVHATLPIMISRGYGRIVNVSSGMGRFVELNGYAVAYRTSKAAINAFTRSVADTVGDLDILINAVCPGWTATAMGGPDAPRQPDRAAEGIVWAATLPAGGITGALLRDGEHFGW